MATPAPGAAPVSRQTQAWRAHWLAEIIRLREEHWGPLEDADAVRQARNAPGTLETRILMRARLLAQREGHDGLAARWRQGAVYSLLGLLAAAVIAGVASAAGALGDGSRPVNVLWALGALLGIHLLTLVLWLASLAAALISLLALLSTASYRFVWPTTLLQPDAFIFLTRALGWLPAQFGFAMPSADVVRASDNTQVLPAVAQAQWSIWLIGV